MIVAAQVESGDDLGSMETALRLAFAMGGVHCGFMVREVFEDGGAGAVFDVLEDQVAEFRAALSMANGVGDA